MFTREVTFSSFTCLPLISARALQAEPQQHPADARREGSLHMGGRPQPRRRRLAALQVLLGQVSDCQVGQRWAKEESIMCKLCFLCCKYSITRVLQDDTHTKLHREFDFQVFSCEEDFLGERSWFSLSVCLSVCLSWRLRFVCFPYASLTSALLLHCEGWAKKYLVITVQKTKKSSLLFGSFFPVEVKTTVAQPIRGNADLCVCLSPPHCVRALGSRTCALTHTRAQSPRSSRKEIVMVVSTTAKKYIEKNY